MYNVVIIGGGPGGYVCAIRCAQLGLKVALVEAADLGGTCLNRGCIPTKTLSHTADVIELARGAADIGVEIPDVKVNFAKVMSRKNRVVAKLKGGIGLLMKKRKVEVISGRGRLVAKGKVEVTDKVGNVTFIEGENVVLATGSSPITPAVFKYDGVNVVTSEELLSLKEMPESLLIIGAGVVGCEFASIFNSLGARIQLVDVMPNILPMVDDDVADVVKKEFEKRGISVKVGTKIASVEVFDGEVDAVTEDGEHLRAQKVLLSIGRRPNVIQSIDPALGIEIGKAGEVIVDEHMRTSLESVWAIGDVTNKNPLAHVASSQGLVAAANIAGKFENMDYTAVPSAIFTNPEVASVGISERQAKDNGIQVKVGRFPFLACGKAVSMNETVGFVKVIADLQDKVVGAQIVGPHASDLISEVTLAISNGLSVEQVVKTVHTHPTLSESVYEACEDILGLAVNI